MTSKHLPVSLAAVMLGLGGFSACSDLRKDLPTQPKSTLAVHPPGWVTPGQPSFHGTYLENTGFKLAECRKCHGQDYAGGISQKTCLAHHDAGELHPPGWANVTSANFHGLFLQQQQWNLRRCQECHGPNYAGGEVGVSCLTSGCHPATPEACTTCHGGVDNQTGAPPGDLVGRVSATFVGVGAHSAHLAEGPLSDAFACNECHVVPDSLFQAGHIDSPLPAELTWGKTATDSSRVTPQWDGQKCSNTYCHGNFKNGNPDNAPLWTKVDGSQAACGTCHGDVTKATPAERALPKTSAQGGTHPNVTQCQACHPRVVDATLNIINKALHVNRRVDLF